ncbi:uncharacterized protein [Mycetomoellerius zeteki]|uniref:uncharacterized protein n=1 Tax=Mycetomoellerius zeteki TaxID=64791 RepID=UPI00084E9EBB|nr:PREDICTED: uncharacterized protein LOC108725497 [Trachymyrmex zeteki]
MLPYYQNDEFLRAEDIYMETSDFLLNALSRLIECPTTPLINRSDNSIAIRIIVFHNCHVSHCRSSPSAVLRDSVRLEPGAKSFTPNAPSPSCATSAASVANVQTVPTTDTAPPDVLLAIAWVDLHTNEGRSFKVRALLDQGFTFSFISESLCQALPPRTQSGPKFSLNPYVFQGITSYAASRTQPLKSWLHKVSLMLKDPDPSSRHQIHLLIGANLYGSLLLQDLRKGPPGAPTAQLTALGWIIFGLTGRGSTVSENTAVCNHASVQDINSLLLKFWEGDSLLIATSLYHKMEKKLSQREDIFIPYHDFLNEYRALGHMIQVDPCKKNVVNPVYIPHNLVLRDSSCTTRLRVVFNASCKTSSGTTLNDHLLVGPKLQQDLSAILLRWRQWRYVYMADIAKMFRQISVHPSDTDFQRILWRPSREAALEAAHFRLLIVTYGFTPAPYLAMRVLKQLSLDERSSYPAAVSVLNDSIYVDDALFGADNVEELVNCRVQLIELL